MELITDKKPHRIIASDYTQIREKTDIYIPAHIDENGNFITEQTPCYSEIIYVPDTFTEKDMYDLYIEEKINE